MHGLSLGCKFRPISLDEQEQDDEGDYDGDVASYPFGEFGAFSGVGFFQEVFPAPAVTCSTEEYIHQASQREQVVADEEVLQIEDGCSFSEGSESAQHVIPEHAGHGEENDRDQIGYDRFPSLAAGKIHCECDNVLKYGDNRRRRGKEHAQEEDCSPQSASCH